MYAESNLPQQEPTKKELYQYIWSELGTGLFNRIHSAPSDSNLVRLIGYHQKLDYTMKTIVNECQVEYNAHKEWECGHSWPSKILNMFIAVTAGFQLFLKLYTHTWWPLINAFE